MQLGNATIRRNLQPATISCMIDVPSQGSGLVQMYDTALSEWAPNRAIEPLTIRPVVKAYAKDGTLGESGTQINSVLSGIKWEGAFVTESNARIVELDIDEIYIEDNLIRFDFGTGPFGGTFTSGDISKEGDYLSINDDDSFTFPLPLGEKIAKVILTAKTTAGTAYVKMCGNEEFESDDYVVTTSEKTFIIEYDESVQDSFSLSFVGDNSVLCKMKMVTENTNVIQWKDISELYSSVTDYTITTDTSSDRGILVFKKNLPSATQLALRFKATYTDNRISKNIPITSDVVTLATNEKALTNYSLYTPDILNYSYNPLLYDADKAETTGYLRIVKFKITKDGKVSNVDTDNFDIGVYDMSGNKVSAGTTYNAARQTTPVRSVFVRSNWLCVLLDLGVDASDHTYKVVMKGKNNNITYSTVYISIHREKPCVAVQNVNMAEFEANKLRKDKCKVLYGNREIALAASMMDIAWELSSDDNARTKTVNVTNLDNISFMPDSGWSTSMNIAYSIEHKSELSFMSATESTVLQNLYDSIS